jgi:hypothetical protein
LVTLLVEIIRPGRTAAPTTDPAAGIAIWAASAPVEAASAPVEATTVATTATNPAIRRNVIYWGMPQTRGISNFTSRCLASARMSWARARAFRCFPNRAARWSAGYRCARSEKVGALPADQAFQALPLQLNYSATNSGRGGRRESEFAWPHSAALQANSGLAFLQRSSPSCARGPLLVPPCMITRNGSGQVPPH